MNHKRRRVLKTGAGLLTLLAGAGLGLPKISAAADWNKAAFDGSKTIQEAFKALGAISPAISVQIVLNAADIAENGAVVPIIVESKIAGTESIALLVEKNRIPLTAAFDIPPGTEASISMRIKMNETSNVFALVKANGKYYVAKKEIKVTLGGCGA